MTTSSNGIRVTPRLLIAALLAGVLVGVAARLLMRLIAVQSGLAGEYTRHGTLAVVLFGTLVGGPLAAAFWLSRPRLPIRPPFAGLGLGALVTVLLILYPPPSARSALDATPDTPALTWLGFGLLLMAWGVALELMTRWVQGGSRTGP